MHCTNARTLNKTALYLFVIHNPRDLLKMIDRESKKGPDSSKIIQKTNMAYLELYTYMNWHRNSHSLAHTSQVSMYLTSHMADHEMIIQFIPKCPL
jgi:hypothetical protein